MYVALRLPQSLSKLAGKRVFPFTSGARLYAKAATSKTHYDALEVPHNATQTQIKSAYYRLTLKFHPDRNKTDLARNRFHEISDAYEVLSNYESRQVYDRSIMVKREEVDPSDASGASAHTATNVTRTGADFDARSRQDYTAAFGRSAGMRREYVTKEKREQHEKFNEYATNRNVHIIFFVCCLFLLTSFKTPDHDIAITRIEPEHK